MRKIDDEELEEIGKEDGEKAFAWVIYCLRLDNMREHLDPNYDPNKLKESDRRSDWLDFELKYKEKKEKENENK